MALRARRQTSQTHHAANLFIQTYPAEPTCDQERNPPIVHEGNGVACTRCLKGTEKKAAGASATRSRSVQPTEHSCHASTHSLWHSCMLRARPSRKPWPLQQPCHGLVVPVRPPAAMHARFWTTTPNTSPTAPRMTAASVDSAEPSCPLLFSSLSNQLRVHSNAVVRGENTVR